MIIKYTYNLTQVEFLVIRLYVMTPFLYVMAPFLSQLYWPVIKSIKYSDIKQQLLNKVLSLYFIEKKLIDQRKIIT